MSMARSESIKEIASALNKAQAEMTGAKKGSNNPFFKSKYADLGSVIDALKTPFADNGLSFSQFPLSHDGEAGVETILMHSSGEWMISTLLLPIKKKDPQGVGDAVTYARRYALQSIAGIPAEDDDGNSNINNQSKPSKPIPITDKGVDEIKAAVAANNSKYVKENWSKIIAKKWQQLDGDTIEKLNILIKEQ